MFTAFNEERNRCGGTAVAANGRIMREGERTRIIRPFAKGSVFAIELSGISRNRTDSARLAGNGWFA
ncbi:hypothetical protein CQZ93_00285 [Ochrobactrum vermis]|nr:hypothetical protein CQZ93_00285 [Ochrobactrum vermis]